MKQQSCDFKLPKICSQPQNMFDYLIKERCIDKDIVNFYYLKGYIYECERDHSVVFVGYDEKVKKDLHLKGQPMITGKRTCMEVTNIIVLDLLMQQMMSFMCLKVQLI